MPTPTLTYLPTCPDCGSDDVRRKVISDSFEYGGREEPITVTADVPVLECAGCGFILYDRTSQVARHKAACLHLGVLSPDEVLAVREKYALSRQQFAELTGLGEASLGRWERGVLIQNEANDRYLRLLAHPDNIERLRAGGCPPVASIPSPTPVPYPRLTPEFRTDVSQQRERAYEFELRPRSRVPSRN